MPDRKADEELALFAHLLRDPLIPERKHAFYKVYRLKKGDLLDLARDLSSKGLSASTVDAVSALELSRIAGEASTCSFAVPLLDNVYERAIASNFLPRRFLLDEKAVVWLRCCSADRILSHLMGWRFAAAAQSWWRQHVGDDGPLQHPPPHLGAIVDAIGRHNLSTAEAVVLAERLDGWAEQVRALKGV